VNHVNFGDEALTCYLSVSCWEKYESSDVPDFQGDALRLTNKRGIVAGELDLD